MTTPNLALPLLAAAQAQKHVTVNEALALIDGLVQLSVKDRDLTAPPASPAEGDRYIVATGATGAWAGWDGDVALFSGGAWLRLTPQEGWRVWIGDEAVLLVRMGSAWTDIGDHLRFTQLGINATADATNRLAVASAATLLSHEGAGHQLKINKAADTDTASLLFQSNWTGHAEMGLLGGDDFTVKVSADGSTFFTGLQIARSTGAVTLPGGWAGTGSAAGRLGGQTVAMVCERNGNVAAGTQLAFGNGSTDTPGAIMPFAGEVLALTVAAAAGTAGTNVFSMAINKVEVTTHQVTLNYSGSGVESAVASFLPSPLAFAPGDTLAVHVNTASPASKVTATIFAAFT